VFGLDTRYLGSLVWKGRPLYAVEGAQVGWGGMGEPVLEDARIVGEVGPGEAEVGVLPDRQRFNELMEAWRAKRRGDFARAAALLAAFGTDPEERPFWPPAVGSSGGFSEILNAQVRDRLRRWGVDMTDEEYERTMRASGFGTLLGQQ